MQPFLPPFVTIPRPSSCWKTKRPSARCWQPRDPKTPPVPAKENAGQLRSAAQSALQGDTAALTQVLNELAADPQAKQAMEQLDQTLNK